MVLIIPIIMQSHCYDQIDLLQVSSFHCSEGPNDGGSERRRLSEVKPINGGQTAVSNPSEKSKRVTSAKRLGVVSSFQVRRLQQWLSLTVSHRHI